MSEPTLKKPLITIVIPVFRNEGTLVPTYDRIHASMELISEKYSYECIFINDGSDDGSGNELLRMRSSDRRVKVVNFVRNFGQLSAVLAGFEHATGDVVVNISADLQDPPELINEMVVEWEKGFKVVLCARAEREDKFFVSLTSRVFYSIIRKAVPSMPQGGFDYFLLDKIVYEKILQMDERNAFLQGNILWTGYQPSVLFYRRLKRQVGKSQWTFAKKIKYFIDGIITTSYFPIRIMSLLGLITALCGFVYSVVILFAWFFHQTPFEGYAPIMVGLLVFFGITMMMLGIIGEYLWRVYDELRNRPKYLIKDKYVD